MFDENKGFYPTKKIFAIFYQEKPDTGSSLALFLPPVQYKMMKRYFALLTIVLFTACTGSDKPDHDETVDVKREIVAAPAALNFSISAQYPHDTSSYIQGLQFYKGKLYEGSGDYANSSLRVTDIKTGKVEKKHMMGTEKIFGEGITIFKDKIYQLTWESHDVYVYDIKNIDKPVKTLRWPYAGWGITNNGNELIISDGTSNIYFVDDSMNVKNTLQVKDNAGFVTYLNELEFIDGFIYANVYLTSSIVKIDPANGHVVGRLVLPDLMKQYAPDYTPAEGEVLNGIAWDSATKKMYITGKRWPKMFEGTIQ